MKSVMKHLFSEVPKAEIQRSSFNRSHGGKTTFDCDYLIPIIVDEILPGDTMNLKTNAFLRLATPIKPIMDNMFVDTFFFFVPNRLVWTNWVKFMGEQDNPGDSTDFTIPTVTVTAASGEADEHTLVDYFGLPINVDSSVNTLYFRAYNLIYNEWFRDENLQDSAYLDITSNGPDGAGDYPLRKRGKRHDYFTSALPWTQKGDSVSIPLGTSAEIHTAAGINSNVEIYQDGSAAYHLLDSDLANVDVSSSTGSGTNVLYADLSSATAATINQLRQAFQIQKLLERDARGGTRYIEMVKAHFGVTSPDARLQRPEYLGGGRARVNVTPVPQTSESNVTDQGNLAGFGTASFEGHGFTKSFVEHGVLIGLMCVTADLTYQNRIDRIWSRDTRFDYFFPVLAHLGEQSILNKEIYYTNTAVDDGVFGYQERYAEYRYKPSNITGLFRSDATGSLDVWHLSQDFGGVPALNNVFIQSATPLDRCIAVPSEPHFIADFYFDYQCARPMPLYGVPGFIDHF